jgi:putative peptidoglycan lipid II flippase
MIGSSILVSSLTLIAGLMSFLNQLVMARLFGASVDMDAYLIAISIPLFVAGVLSAVLSYSLVPALVAHKADPATYRRFAGLLLLCLIAVAMVIACAGFVAAPTQVGILGGSLPIQAQADAIRIARISWMTVGLTLVVGHLNAMHNADRFFLIPVTMAILPFVGMIVGGLAFGSSHGPLAIAWGMSAGYLLAIPALLLRSLPTLDLSTHCLRLWKDVAGYLIRAPLMLLAMLCFTVYQSIDAYWAPQVGTGNLSYLGYAQRILVGIGTLVIAGPSAVLMPRLAEAHAEGRVTDLLHDTARTVRGVIAFATPAAIFISLLAAPLVRLCFERGAFDHQTTLGVAGVLPVMMLGMVMMLCVVILFRALFSRHDFTRAALLGILATVSYFGLSGFLSQWWGVKGIAIAYAFSWSLVLVLAALSLWRGHIVLLLCRENRLFAGRLVVIAMAMAVVVIGGRYWINAPKIGSELLLLQLGLIAVLACMTYFTVAIRILKVDEVCIIYEFLFRKIAEHMPQYNSWFSRH